MHVGENSQKLADGSMTVIEDRRQSPGAGGTSCHRLSTPSSAVASSVPASLLARALRDAPDAALTAPYCSCSAVVGAPEPSYSFSSLQGHNIC
jgi:hypothetical protein